MIYISVVRQCADPGGREVKDIVLYRLIAGNAG
jgi:hypothetical protein